MPIYTVPVYITGTYPWRKLHTPSQQSCNTLVLILGLSVPSAPHSEFKAHVVYARPQAMFPYPSQVPTYLRAQSRGYSGSSNEYIHTGNTMMRVPSTLACCVAYLFRMHISFQLLAAFSYLTLINILPKDTLVKH